MIKSGVIAVIFVVGALSLGASDKKPSKEEKQQAELKAAVDKAVDSYGNCLSASADSHSAGPGTPTEIADAALAECGHKLGAYEKAVQDFLIAQVQKHRSIDFAVATADRRVAETKEQMRGLVISRVLKARESQRP